MALGTMQPDKLPEEFRPDPGNLRYGLFNVAPPGDLEGVPVPGLADHAFGGGMYYDPKGCGRARSTPIDCAPGAKTFDPNSPETKVLPFNVYATLQCSKGGYTQQYLSDKTGDRLFSSEQEAVEAAFWTGAAANAPFITDAVGAVNVAGGATTYATLTDAVAALERFAASGVDSLGAATGTPYGYAPVLHAVSSVAAYAADANLLHTAALGFGAVWGAPASEPILRTPLGSKWIFGGGYTGTGPAAAAPGAGKTYIWVTGNVASWRQKTWTPPDQQAVMDRQLNQYKILAERGYLVTYDCFHAYALVAIPKAPA